MNNETVTIKHWQIGYRIFGIGSYTAPYTDLPQFDATQRQAYDLLKQLDKDFDNAEWRLVEVR